MSYPYADSLLCSTSRESDERRGLIAVRAPHSVLASHPNVKGLEMLQPLALQVCEILADSTVTLKQLSTGSIQVHRGLRQRH